MFNWNRNSIIAAAKAFECRPKYFAFHVKYFLTPCQQSFELEGEINILTQTATSALWHCSN